MGSVRQLRRLLRLQRIIGGDGLNGKVDNGHCYVASRGNFTEVTRTIYMASSAHAISVLVTLPLALLRMAWKEYRRIRDGENTKTGDQGTV